MTQAYLELMDVVQMTRSRWRLLHGLDGVLVVFTALAGVLVAGAAIDQWVDLSVPGRVAAHGCLWIAAAMTVWRNVFRPVFAAHGDDYYAALIEQRFPFLGNRFINALQLGREPRATGPKLVEAIVNDALTVVDEIDVSRAGSARTLRRHLAFAAALATVLLGYIMLFGPAARTSVARVLLPTADIAPFTWTRLTVSPDQTLHVLEGAPLTIKAQTGGRLPEQAWLRWRTADGRRNAMRMTDTGKGAFVYAFPAVEAGFGFHVTAGDAASPQVQVVVDARPRIETLAVTYQPPAYTALPARTIDASDGHLYGLAQTVATLTVTANKDLESLLLTDGDQQKTAFKPSADARTWTTRLTLTANGSYRLTLRDTQGYTVDDPTMYSIMLQHDAPPLIAFTRPGRDIQRQPDGAVEFQLAANDDLGLGEVKMLAQVNQGDETITIQSWPNDQPKPRRRALIEFKKTIDELGLRGGDQMQYWATVVDRNPAAPGSAQTRKFNIIVLTAEQAQAWSDQQMSDYARVVRELIRLQRLNRSQTQAADPAPALINRQGLIRRHSLQLADVMERNDFPAKTVIAELRELAHGPMAQMIADLESSRDAPSPQSAKRFAAGTLVTQDAIIEALEAILLRLDRNEQIRKALKKLQRKDQPAYQLVDATMRQVAEDLDKFLIETRDLDEKFEKLAKRNSDDLIGEELKTLEDIEHRMDRWKQWSKDSVDEIAKLPAGFVKDSHLAEDISTIFEEIEKKKRPDTIEIATPLEEGARMLATEVLEDLEIWMPDHGDNLKWVMEEPLEGQFEVPPMTLPESLQDMVGDLIEDMDEFDFEADDVTSSWGGNMQVGWDTMDGPISVFSAQGKTGNQLPNNSEITGRSGGGRRGRASGQMVGAESRAYEGRPTPARVTREPYEEGVIDAKKQLAPRGATGGGRKTGGGQRGLQGGTPPDFVRDMARLTQRQKMLREKFQRVVRQFELAGQSSWRLDRAQQLIDTATQDMQDRRYGDAARKRKVALRDLKALQGGVDQAVALELNKARNLPPRMREQIATGVQEALPEGFEELVGTYYKALSATQHEQVAP